MSRRILGRVGLPVTLLGDGRIESCGLRTWGVRVVSDHQAERFHKAVLNAGDRHPLVHALASPQSRNDYRHLYRAHLAENLEAAALGALPIELLSEITARVAKVM